MKIYQDECVSRRTERKLFVNKVKSLVFIKVLRYIKYLDFNCNGLCYYLIKCLNLITILINSSNEICQINYHLISLSLLRLNTLFV